MKALDEFRRLTGRRTGLILLFVGEVARRTRDGPDEHTQTGILTSGLNLAPAFPNRFRDPVALGVCSPLQWRNRPRFTRGSLTSDCVLEDHAILRVQRTARVLRACGGCAKLFHGATSWRGRPINLVPFSLTPTLPLWARENLCGPFTNPAPPPFPATGELAPLPAGEPRESQRKIQFLNGTERRRLGTSPRAHSRQSKNLLLFL